MANSIDDDAQVASADSNRGGGHSGRAERPGPATSSAAPPAAGRTDQHSILAAAHKTVHGPASSDRLAAIGGLEVPVGDTAPADDATATDPASALIPGAREADTLTHREAGAIGGAFTGADIPAGEAPWLDTRTASDHRLEGGGRGVQQPEPKPGR